MKRRDISMRREEVVSVWNRERAEKKRWMKTRR